MKKVEVNEDACIGCGDCQGIAPEVFELTDDGKARALVTETDDDEVVEAAECCPTGAIEINE